MKCRTDTEFLKYDEQQEEEEEATTTNIIWQMNVEFQ